jgi:hypothetical protein
MDKQAAADNNHKIGPYHICGAGLSDSTSVLRAGTMDHVIHTIDWNNPKITEFSRRWEITELSLFGSLACGDFSAESNIDVLVTFSASADWGLLDHVQMEQELEGILGRPVDLVSRRAIERSSNSVRRREILQGAQTAL